MRLVVVVSMLAVGCSETSLSRQAEPEAPVCPQIPPATYVPDVLDTCERAPQIGPFDPVVEWEWTENPTHPGSAKVEIPPIVFHLDDDDGDGAAGPGDVPDLVFSTFAGSAYNGTGKLVMISGAERRAVWSLSAADGRPFHALSGVAAALMGDSPTPAIIATATNALVRLHPDGTVQWVSDAVSRGTGRDAPAIADVDGDGIAEIVLGSQIFAADGTLLSSAPDDNGVKYQGSFPADLDGDGLMEIVFGGGVLDHDSQPLWFEGSGSGWPALGDLDGDGRPEIIEVTTGRVTAYSVDGEVVWVAPFADRGGGPPTVADFDGDGQAEVGVASKAVYRVYDGDGTELWQRPIVDASSGVTGSSVFDFEGDGAAEVVQADEGTLWVFDGSTGAVEMQWTEHNSGTRFEYPVIADVDADGSAEIILGSGRNKHGTTRSGITIIGSEGDTWAPARELWNQHAYHISNIEEDGSIPVEATPQWLDWNSFRSANSETAQGLAQANLVAGSVEVCVCDRGKTSLWLPIENQGVVDTPTVSILVEYRNGEDWTTQGMMVDVGPGAGEVAWLGPIDLDLGDGEVRLTLDPEDLYDECDESDNVVIHEVVGCGQSPE